MEIGNKNFNVLGQYNDTVKRLSARLKADSFFYAIHDVNTNRLLANDVISLDDLDGFDAILDQDLDSVVVAIDNHLFTQVNIQEFEVEKSNLLFNHLSENTTNKEYLNDQIGGTEIVNVYASETTVFDQVNKQFPKAQFIHFSTSLINDALRYSRTSVHAYYDGNDLSITFVKEGALYFHNKFQVKTANEFLYHIGLIYQEFGINREEIPLILSGEIYPNSEMLNTIFDYFKHIEFAEVKNFISSQENEGIIPSHYYDQLIIH